MPEGFQRGLDRFFAKKDLYPFAQAKFLGHNAVHATLGYLAKDREINFMHEVGKDSILMEKAKTASLARPGAA